MGELRVRTIQVLLGNHRIVYLGLSIAYVQEKVDYKFEMVDWGQIRELLRWRRLLFNEHFNILQAIKEALKIFWSEKKFDHRQVNLVVTIRMNWSMERLEDFWEVYWGSILIPWLRWEVLRAGTWAVARKNLVENRFCKDFRDKLGNMEPQSGSE